MAVRSTVSLTEEQDAFARRLVESGRFSSISAALQHALELLRRNVEDDESQSEALRALLAHRREGAFISSDELRSALQSAAARKRAGDEA